TLNDALPAGAGGDLLWTIDPNTGNPGNFQVTGAQGSQVLMVTAAGSTLAPGASESVHITSPTTAADTGGPGSSTFVGVQAMLGGAVDYAVLYTGTGGHNFSITNVGIHGNVGVAGTGVVQFSGPGTITG